MRSWGTPVVFAGLLVLCVVVSAIELPTGPNVPTNAAITLTGASLEGVSEAAEAATPSRVLPTPAIMSTRVSVKLSSKQSVPQDVPAGGWGWSCRGHAELGPPLSWSALWVCDALHKLFVWHAAKPGRLCPALSFPTSFPAYRSCLPHMRPAGTPFAGEYIVLFKENVADVEAVTERCDNSRRLMANGNASDIAAATHAAA